MERAERKGRADVAAEIREQLRCPPFPQALNYIWTAYNAMRRRKAHGHSGPNPVEWNDIAMYSAMTGTRFAPWEAILITEIDDLYLAQRYAEIAEETKPQPAAEGGIVRKTIGG